MSLHHASDHKDPSASGSAAIVNDGGDEDNTRCGGAAAAAIDADATGEDSGVRHGNPLSRDVKGNPSPRDAKQRSQFRVKPPCLPPATSIHWQPHPTPYYWRPYSGIANRWGIWLQRKNELEAYCDNALMRLQTAWDEHVAHKLTLPMSAFDVNVAYVGNDDWYVDYGGGGAGWEEGAEGGGGKSVPSVPNPLSIPNPLPRGGNGIGMKRGRISRC